MRSITATEAKNKFGDLMHMVAAGPIAITKNNKIVAILSPISRPNQSPGFYLDKLLAEYSAGGLSRRELEEATGLCFGDVLSALGERGLSLPRVDSTKGFNPEQMGLLNKVFPRK